MTIIITGLTVAMLLTFKLSLALISFLIAYAIALRLWARFSSKYQQQKKVNYLIIINSQSDLDTADPGKANINN